MSAADNPQAFPTSSANPGMSLRDWFAGQALAGQVAFSPSDEFEKAHMPKDVARLAYKFADAMIAARGKS